MYGGVFLSDKFFPGVFTRWALFLLVSVAVLYGIFRPEPPAMLFEYSDKVGHVLAFCALALTGRLALFVLPKTGFWLSMLLLCFALEYLQGELRPFRMFSLEDAYANVVGVLLAVAMLELFFRHKLNLVRD